jgi:glucokinase
MKQVFAIDIGGTNTKTGLIDSDGAIVSFLEIDTPKSGGVEAEVGAIKQAQESLKFDIAAVDAIGIGVPGPVDCDGVVYNPPNLKGWGEVHLRKYISECFGIGREKIFIGSDATMAALAEFRYGHGKGANPMVMVTLGTGLGGGVIIDGRPMGGKNGFAGEFGHTVIDPQGYRCGCGRIGCVETIVTHKGIVRTALELLKKDKGSLLWGMMEGSFDQLTPKSVQEAADLGDPTANKTLEITAAALGQLLANLINTFNPEKIVVGGGISLWGDKLLEPAKKIAHKNALKHLAKQTEIVRAKYVKKAGVIGAAANAFACLERV